MKKDNNKDSNLAMKYEISIRRATTDDIGSIHDIAYQVWPVTYGDTIASATLEYMLEFIYHPGSLLNQMKEQVFLIAERAGEAIGFAS